VQKTVVLNVVGLTPNLIGEHTPRLRAFRDAGAMATIGGVLPAVTCSVQATYLTGAWPSDHGIVGNGWYFRDECEIKFWRQSNRLVQRPPVWEVAKARDPRFTCANVCWWYAMYSSAEYTVTPRPMYPSDGRKLPDCWTNPPGLRHELQAELGQFPLFKFWGPATSIESTRWIADAAVRIDQRYDPTLTLVYLPHLDYGLQRVGPAAPSVAADLRDVDAVCGQLFDHFAARAANVIVLSEYGIAPVSKPVHLNRIFRERGWVTVRDELGGELLDAGASRAFAVADHQVAHVYVNDASILEEVRDVVANTDGVADVLEAQGKRAAHLDHARAGDLVAVAAPDAWFTYYYWLDDARRPDFANTVDIHRKPGYDPVDLFLDPQLKLAKAKIGWTLLKRKAGFRALLDVIGTDATVVCGSHGRLATLPGEGPLFMTNTPGLLAHPAVSPIDVHALILGHLAL